MRHCDWYVGVLGFCRWFLSGINRNVLFVNCDSIMIMMVRGLVYILLFNWHYDKLSAINAENVCRTMSNSCSIYNIVVCCACRCICIVVLCRYNPTLSLRSAIVPTENINIWNIFRFGNGNEWQHRERERASEPWENPKRWKKEINS